MNNQNIKKICTVSLIGSQRVMAIGAYNGEMLAIRSLTTYSGILKQWLTDIGADLKKYQDAGFEILIESQNAEYEQYGRVITMDQVDETERRTMQNIGLDHYYDMLDMGESKDNRRGAISLPKSHQQHFLSSNLIYIEQDDKGRNRYKIDKDQSGLNGYHKAVVLAALVARHFNDIGEAYIKQLTGMIGAEIKDSPVDRMMNIMEGRAGIYPNDKESFPRKLGLS